MVSWLVYFEQCLRDGGLILSHDAATLATIIQPTVALESLHAHLIFFTVPVQQFFF